MASLRLGRRFTGLAALAAACFAAALATGGRALVLLGFLLTALAAVAPLRSRRVRVEATLGHRQPSVAEDEPFDVDVRLRARGWRGAVVDACTVLPGPASIDEGSPPNASVRFLRAGAEADASFRVRFQLFGLQKVGPVRVRAEDPFRLATAEAEAAPALGVRVYPRRDRMRDPVLRAKQIRSVLGLYDVPQPGNSFEFYGLRDYSVGDRPRDVNWKASARTGGLVVNQHQKESDTEIVLLVDARAATLAGRASQSPFAQGCRAALTIGEAHLRARDAARLVAYGDGLHEDRHTGATRRIQGLLDLVVGLAPAGDMGLAMAVRRILPSLKPRSPVMVVSPLVDDPTVQEAVSMLQSHGLAVSVLVPAPAWPDPQDDAALLWQARQEHAIRSLRRMGLPVAAHAAGAPLAASLETLEVRA